MNFMTGFIKGFKQFGENIALTVNTLLLVPVYVFGVGITSGFAKIANKSFLDTWIDKKKKSYWTNYSKIKNKESYLRQF